MIKSPGSIRSEKEITIQLSTFSAIRIFHGREKKSKRSGIMGLPGFSKHLNTIERAIKLDDPYADHYFMIIEEAIENLKIEFEKLSIEIEEYIQNNTPGMDLSRSVSSEPLVIPIKFASRMSFKLLFQIIKADEIILKVLQANHIGLLPNDEKFKMIAHIEKNIRAVIHKVFGFKYTGVTRDDIAANNKKAILAQETMGELEKEILEGTKRSPEAPRLPTRRAELEEQLTSLDIKESAEHSTSDVINVDSAEEPEDKVEEVA